MRFLTDSFPTAKANMAFDDRLAQEGLDLEAETVCRFYEWPDQASLTVTKGKPLPPDLQHIDHAPRVTGGGIVFHAPKDVVFCCVIPQGAPHFPKGAKEKMALMSDWINVSLERIGCQVDTQPPTSGHTNHQYCNSYPNPYELFVNSEKVCAIALRKFRSALVMQGVIHLSDSSLVFGQLPDAYHAFFTKGLLGIPLDAETVISSVRSTLMDKLSVQTH